MEPIQSKLVTGFDQGTSEGKTPDTKRLNHTHIPTIYYDSIYNGIQTRSL